MRTKESEEMYLETILLLQRRKPEVRSVDVVEELGLPSPASPLPSTCWKSGGI